MELLITVDSRLHAVHYRGGRLLHDYGIISRSQHRMLSELAAQRKNLWRRVWEDFRRRGWIPFGMGFAAFLAEYALTGRSSPIAFSLVTTAGVNYMASDFASGGVTPTISGFKFQDSGTGTIAAAVGDTALGAAAGPARVSGTASNPTANQYRSVATIAYTATLAITEWGLFSAATGATLWDRRVFAAINVVSGDSIQFTYTLTIASGGT